jgi:hypothetical protein
MWLFGPFNKCIFSWTGAVDNSTVPVETADQDFLTGLLSNSMKRILREMKMDENSCRRERFQDLTLTLCLHKGFLMVLDAESDRDLDVIEPELRKSISDAINEEPLAFGQLLSDYDMPGRNKLVTRLRSVLETQH